MKGILFTQFLEMVESMFSERVADEVIVSANLKSRGAYTTVATYDHGELINLVKALSSKVGLPSHGLMKAFGKFVFRRFATVFPESFRRDRGLIDFLSNIESMIQAEVRKLHPDAELPKFEARKLGRGHFELIYKSQRPFADLAEGLIEEAIQYFDEPFDLHREDIPTSDGFQSRFALTQQVVTATDSSMPQLAFA